MNDGFPNGENDWERAIEFEGLPLFTRSYGYHLASREILKHIANSPVLRYPKYCIENSPVVFMAFEAFRQQVGGLKLSVLASPQSLYIPYWDFSIPKTDAGCTSIPDLASLFDRSTIGDWDVIRISNVLQGSVFLDSLKSQSVLSWRSTPAPPCDYIVCCDLDTFLSRVSKNFRASLRKARNKLSLHKDVRFESHRSEIEVRDALGRFFLLECRGWKGESTGAISQNFGVRSFYELLYSSFSKIPSHWVEVNELWVDDCLLSSQLCLGVSDTLFVLKIAYDEEYPKLSPGNMLLEWIITRDSNVGRVKNLNLISDSSWHKDWAALQIPNWHVEVYNKTPSAYALRLARYLKDRFDRRSPQQSNVPLIGV